jgi:hypothetical protein
MPWEEKRLKAAKAKLDKEADRVKAKTGARTVAIIAFFDDGSPSLMLLEGGTAPVSSEQLYGSLHAIYVRNRQALEAKEKDQPKPTNDEPSTVQ